MMDFSLLFDASLVTPIALTLKACGASLLLFALVGIPLAWLCARHDCFASRCLMMVATLPLVLPPVALGYLLLLVLGIQGPVGALLYSLFGTRVIFSEGAVCLAAFVAGLPLVLRPIKIAFESPTLRELETVARTCGAKPLTVFWTVTLPCVRNAVLAALLLGTARASGEVGITMMIGGNVAGRTNTLSLEIFNAVSRGDFDAATLLCVVLAAVAIALYVALEVLRGRSTL